MEWSRVLLNIAADADDAAATLGVESAPSSAGVLFTWSAPWFARKLDLLHCWGCLEQRESAEPYLSSHANFGEASERRSLLLILIWSVRRSNREMRLLIHHGKTAKIDFGVRLASRVTRTRAPSVDFI